ncbi:hypothetical protein J813_3216 [Acinetobacter sp. 25977_10]|nr:hypothetical protein J813_3216 [Acinetobacter sp. 25977_10]
MRIFLSLFSVIISHFILCYFSMMQKKMPHHFSDATFFKDLR